MYTSFKRHIDILPSFGNLGTISIITKLLVPDSNAYIGYTTSTSVYAWFGDSIANLLFDPKVIDGKQSPQAHQVIITNSNTYNR